MKNHKNIKLFEDKKVRSLWNEDEEQWYFSIIDAVAVLTESIDSNAYWRKLKQRLKEEGNETVTNCHALKLEAIDGKMRFTDVATTEQLFRLIQSIPSKKAEPFKLWLAKVAKQGGKIAGNARKELEAKTGKKVISKLNAKNFLNNKNLSNEN